MVNETTSTIVEIENGSARYEPGLINRIEHALKTQIPRGRVSKKKSKAKKY